MAGRPEPASGRPDAPAIDWIQAAHLLARGGSVTAVAKRVGCSRSALSRRKNRDRTFQSWVACCRRGIDPTGDTALVELEDAVRRAIETEVEKGNVRVILWLADRLKLLVPPDDRAPGNQLDRLMRELSPAELEEFHSLQGKA